MKSRRMRWAGHVTRMGQMRNLCKIFVGESEGKRPLENIDADGKIILNDSFRNRLRSCILDSTVVNTTLNFIYSIKGGAFLE